MSRAPSNFRQQDVSRAIRAAKVAGLDVQRVEIDGKRIIVVVKEGETEVKINPFDTAPTWSAQKRKKKCASD